MLRAIGRRALISIPLLLGVSMLTFVLAAITPGDPGRTILGTTATPEAVRQIDDQLGFNRPLLEQYWSWLTSVLHGDFGMSIFTGEPVADILNNGFPVTVTLIIGAVVVSCLIGIPLGVESARLGRLGGKAVSVLSLVGYALPTFWLGLVLVLFFSIKLGLLPSSGWVNPSDSLGGWLQALVLPTVTLAAGGASILAKQTRDGMMDVLAMPYIQGLRARGIPTRSVVYRHALRNALPNTVTLVGLYVVSLLLGTTLVESVFVLPGLGSTAVTATSQHNLPVLEGTAFVFTVIVVVSFTVVDLVRAWLNPKLRDAR